MKYFSLIALMLVMSLFFVSCSSTDDDEIKDPSNTLSDEASDLMSDLDDDKDKVEDDIRDDLSDDEVKDDEKFDEDMVDNDTSDTIKDEEDKITNDNSVDFSDESVLPANSINFDTLDNSIKTWGQGHNVDDENRPIACLDYDEKYGDYDTYFINEDNNNIYLTFDQGYENGFTERILDILKEKDCPATFFVTMDYATKNPDLIERMIRDGHVIGNHSTSHPSFPSLSTAQIMDEITLLHDYIESNFNYVMNALRPPRGEFSEKTLAVTQSMGYSTYLWSFAYQDWEVDNQPDVSEAFEKVSGAVHNGAIYLLHSVSKTNTEILPKLIDTLRDDGYEFEKLS